MKAFSIIVLLLLLHRYALPLFLRRTEFAWELLHTRRADWLLMIGEGEPTLLYYVFKALLPTLYQCGFRSHGPIAHYLVRSAPAPGESLAAFADRELFFQDYYHLNLLNRRSLTLVRQRHLAGPEIKRAYCESSASWRAK